MLIGYGHCNIHFGSPSKRLYKLIFISMDGHSRTAIHGLQSMDDVNPWMVMHGWPPATRPSMDGDRWMTSMDCIHGCAAIHAQRMGSLACLCVDGMGSSHCMTYYLFDPFRTGPGTIFELLCYNCGMWPVPKTVHGREMR